MKLTFTWKCTPCKFFWSHFIHETFIFDIFYFLMTNFAGNMKKLNEICVSLSWLSPLLLAIFSSIFYTSSPLALSFNHKISLSDVFCHLLLSRRQFHWYISSTKAKLLLNIDVFIFLVTSVTMLLNALNTGSCKMNHQTDVKTSILI